MDGIENIGQSTPTGLQLDINAKTHLKETAKWAKLLAIIGMIIMGFVVLLGIVMMVSISSLSSLSPELGMMGGMMGVGVGLFYIAMAVLYIYPIWKLYQFADLSKKALMSEDSDLLRQAFEAQKSMYKFWGILMIVLLAIYALIFVVSIGGVMLMGLGD
jgi:Family of unknown function (DUF5362)